MEQTSAPYREGTVESMTRKTLEQIRDAELGLLQIKGMEVEEDIQRALTGSLRDLAAVRSRLES